MGAVWTSTRGVTKEKATYTDDDVVKRTSKSFVQQASPDLISGLARCNYDHNLAADRDATEWRVERDGIGVNCLGFAPENLNIDSGKFPISELKAIVSETSSCDGPLDPESNRPS